MGRASKEELRRREMAFLGLVLRGCDESGQGAELSVRVVGAKLGLTEQQVHRLLKSVGEAGYVKVQHRFDACGGQLPNLYRLTESGRVRLAELAISMA